MMRHEREGRLPLPGPVRAVLPYPARLVCLFRAAGPWAKESRLRSMRVVSRLISSPFAATQCPWRDMPVSADKEIIDCFGAHSNVALTPARYRACAGALLPLFLGSVTGSVTRPVAEPSRGRLVFGRFGLNRSPTTGIRHEPLERRSVGRHCGMYFHHVAPLIGTACAYPASKASASSSCPPQKFDAQAHHAGAEGVKTGERDHGAPLPVFSISDLSAVRGNPGRRIHYRREMKD